MAIFEIIIYTILVLLFLILVIAEIVDILGNNGRSNFLLDHYVQRTLIPEMNKKETIDQVCDFYLKEHHTDFPALVWRQALSISFVSSFLSVCVVKIFLPRIPFLSFILLFITLFFFLLLMTSLINYHFYGVKMQFVYSGFEKIHVLNQKADCPSSS